MNVKVIISDHTALDKPRPRGYLATVIDLYGSHRYAQSRARVLRRWPGTLWIEPAHMNWTNSEWLAAWPGILATLDLLAVIPRADGTIGRGCWRELTDCQTHSIPVYALRGGRWSRRFTLERLPGDSFRYWGIVRWLP